MRIAPLIMLLVVCGCDQGRSGTGKNQTIRNGIDRLVLKYVPTPVLPNGGSGYDFDSLVLERQDGDLWSEHAVITQQQFEAGTDRRRWVSELDSFDPSTSNAIIKVAEGNASKDSEIVSYVYSWREWSLRTNGEVRFIRVCIDPFEKF